MKVLLLGLFCSYSFISIVNSSFCFWNSGCAYKHFSSQTPYTSVRGDIRDSKLQIKDCAPVSIWALYRYGKRYPSKYYARKMEEALQIKNFIAESYDQGKSSLCAQDVENLKAWPMDSKMFKGVNSLTSEGYQEMLGIGKRLRSAYSALLANLKQGQYMFRPTSGDVTEESAKAYVEGIGDSQYNIDKAQDESIIAPYKSCDKYQTEVKANPKTYAESDKYQKGSEFLATKDRIQRRAGIDLKLTDDNVTALYDLCRYLSSGIENKPSPWCALFTSEDLQVLEYNEDLKQYYRNGYGTPMNEIFGRITLADLLKSFQQAKSGEGKKITAYFSGSTAIDMTLSALGLFKDKEHLSGTKRIKNRSWSSSRQSTFSSNIMAVLSKCTTEGPRDDENYNVVFYLNEEPIRSICENGICPWKEFEDKMTPFVDTNIDFCNLNGIL